MKDLSSSKGHKTWFEFPLIQKYRFFVSIDKFENYGVQIKIVNIKNEKINETWTL
jgi:hypothetical protein